MQEDILASFARPCSFCSNIPLRGINRYGLPCDPTLWSFTSRPNWRLNKDGAFQETQKGEQPADSRNSLLLYRDRISSLVANHRPDIRPLPKKPEPRKL